MLGSVLSIIGVYVALAALAVVCVMGPAFFILTGRKDVLVWSFGALVAMWFASKRLKAPAPRQP
jgi:hypothetical protein